MIALLGGFLLSAPVGAMELLCGDRENVLAWLLGSHREKPVAYGTTKAGPLEVYASEAGGFTIVVTPSSDLMCLLASGSEWAAWQPHVESY